MTHSMRHTNSSTHKFEKTVWVFYGSSLNDTSLTCGLIIVETTTGKEPDKDPFPFRELFRMQVDTVCSYCIVQL